MDRQMSHDVHSAVLGLDFGAKTSKMTLAFFRTPARPEIDRVSSDVPEAYSSTRGIFEFPAEAALDENGRLVVSVEADKCGGKFSLKTAFLYCAGITRAETLADLPGSPIRSQLSPSHIQITCATAKRHRISIFT